jgi:hypothetical protein
MILHMVHYTQDHEGDGGPSWDYVFQTRELADAMAARIIRSSVRSEHWDLEPEEIDAETVDALEDFNDWANGDEFLHVTELEVVACQRKMNQLELPGM